MQTYFYVLNNRRHHLLLLICTRRCAFICSLMEEMKLRFLTVDLILVLFYDRCEIRRLLKEFLDSIYIYIFNKAFNRIQLRYKMRIIMILIN